MITYVTVADVDAALDDEWWADENGKTRAVMLANAWLNSQGLPEVDPHPPEFKMAGAEIARDVAYGNMYYGDMQTGILSQSVRAGDVASSKTFSSTARMVTVGEQVALALLKPWISGRVVLLKRI